MRKTLFIKYKRFVIYIEILLFLLLLPVLYNLVPLNDAARTFYISSAKLDDVTKSLEQIKIH